MDQRHMSKKADVVAPTEDRSRMPGFYRLSVKERLQLLRERGLLSREDYRSLVSGAHMLDIERADKMIENVIGVLGMPVGLGLNRQAGAQPRRFPRQKYRPHPDRAGAGGGHGAYGQSARRVVAAQGRDTESCQQPAPADGCAWRRRQRH